MTTITFGTMHNIDGRINEVQVCVFLLCYPLQKWAYDASAFNLKIGHQQLLIS